MAIKPLAQILNRRCFIHRFGLAMAGVVMTPTLLSAWENNQEVFASSYQDQHRQQGVALLDTYGNILAKHPLPDRGHDSVSHSKSGWIVTFARRPGNFALAINQNQSLPNRLFYTPEHMHFYGHGVFCSDGRLLFATENDYENERGVIGIYDTHNDFLRVDELSSYGVGPHEIIMMPDGHTLCIANGGIATHPDFGRTKLNLASMQPSIVFVNSQGGELVEKFELPDTYRQLSLRHLDVTPDHIVWLGGQYQGYVQEDVPLIMCIHPDKGLTRPDLPLSAINSLGNYIGSVKCGLNQIAFTSPKSGQLLVIDQQARIVQQSRIPQVCGVNYHKKGFIFSTLDGYWGKKRQPLYWDNHLNRIKV